MEIAVVIVNYRSRDVLAECLRALEAGGLDLAGGAGAAADASAGERTPAAVVVVDNDSRDGSAEMLAERFPRVRLIANPENVGYARAVNQGVTATAAPFVLVMNPDCVPRPGAVRALLDYACAHPRVAIAAPRILNPDESLEYSARSFPGPLTFLFNRYSLLTRLLPGNRWSRRYLLSDWDHRSAREVDWVSGACMLVRREAIAAVGGMDEAFFMFNEDVDWCRRMKLAGWSTVYVADAVIVHHIGASRGKVAARVIWARHLGMIHYFRKHHPTHPLVEALVGGVIVARAGLMLLANALRAR